MKTERTRLTNKLDAVFSEWIRRRYADENGQTVCYTCGAVKHWKQMHAGHFMSRGKKSTRWHPQNVQVQCVSCNIFKAGEQFKFAQNLDEEHGVGTAEKLQYLSNQAGKYTIPELRKLVKRYQDFLSELE